MIGAVFLELLAWMISNLPSSSNLLCIHSPPLLSSLNVQISTRLRVRGFTTEQAAQRTNLYFKALHANSGQHYHHHFQSRPKRLPTVHPSPEAALGCWRVCVWCVLMVSPARFTSRLLQKCRSVLFNQSHLVACTENVRWCSKGQDSGVVERAQVWILAGPHTSPWTSYMKP